MGSDHEVFTPTAKVQFTEWLRPWRELAQHPGPLIKWALITVALGSMGFWLSPLLARDPWISIAGVTSLGTFGIVLLAEAYAGAELSPMPSSLERAWAGRSIALALTFVLVVLQAALVMRIRGLESASLLSQRDLSMQFGLTLGAIIVAIYLLCFRLGELESSVFALKAREDATVNTLAETANRASVTPEGEAL